MGAASPTNRITKVMEDRGEHISMLTIHRDICGYCGACVSICPEDALELIDTYLTAGDSCRNCGLCARVCPVGALEVTDEGSV